MANQTTLVPSYSFVKGLVTDAGPLAATENQCSSMLNVVLDVDGSISVRPGVELHAGDFSVGDSPSGSCFAYAESMGVVGGSEDIRYLCVYLGGTRVYLFNVTDIDNITKVGEQVVLPTPAAVASLTAAKGYFILATDVARPKLITLATHTDVTIQIRDMIGLDDGLELTERPAELSDAHKYNLLNQGWPMLYAKQVAWPSNADIPWVGVRTQASTGREIFDKTQLKNVSFGNSPAPKGSMVVDAFNTANISAPAQNSAILSMSYDHAQEELTITVAGDITVYYTAGDSVTVDGTRVRYSDGVDTITTNVNGTKTLAATPTYSSTTDLSTLVLDVLLSGYVSDFTPIVFGRLDDVVLSPSNPDPVVELNNPVATCAFAGRVFFGGVNPATNNRLRGTVFYSQVLTDISNVGKCYQEQDPTARQLNEVVASDGGEIQVADMGIVYQMLPLKGSLLLFADNGVWVLSGRDGIFDPTNFTVDKVSTRGVQSTMSAADVDGGVVYYSNGSIYSVGTDEFGGWQARPLSDGIKTYLDTLPNRDDTKVQFSFNRENKVAYLNFLGNTGISLCLDTRLGAFYPLRLPIKAGHAIVFQWSPHHNFKPNLGSLLFALKSTTDVQVLAMTDDEATVDAWSAEPIEAHATTAPALLDTAMIKKQMPRVQVYTKRAAGSSVKVQGRFSWGNNGDSGKWGSKQEGYFERGEDFDVCWRTLSVRGIGKATQLHFTNEGESYFKLYGWDIKYTVNPE